MGLGDTTHTPRSALSVSRPGFIWSELEGSLIGPKQQEAESTAGSQPPTSGGGGDGPARPSKTTDDLEVLYFDFEMCHMVSFHSICLPTNVWFMLVR